MRGHGPSGEMVARGGRIFTEDEWSPLKEVIVGRPEFSQFPSEKMCVMASIVPRYYLDEFRPNNPFPADIIEKAREELENFAEVLESYGVKVHRPELVDWGKVGGYTGCMPRDGLMVVGDTVFESCFSWHCRRHEIELAYGGILRKLRDKGYKIIAAPKPPNPDRIFDVDPGAKWCINNSRVAFDAADFIRLGKTVVGQHSNTTNEKGVEFVRAHLPVGYNLIVIDVMNKKEMHIDATFVPIGDGTALYNPDSVSLEELLSHKPLNTWRLLPRPFKLQWPKYPPPYMCTPLLSMNVLCLDEKRVFCEKDDVKMQGFYRELGMEPIPLPFKHQVIRSNLASEDTAVLLGARYEPEFADVFDQQLSLDWLLPCLKPNSNILDIGSGTGRPVAKRLTDACHHVTGLDISSTMIRLAQANVPTATFKQIDVRSFSAPAQIFDVVCSYFALFHMPRAAIHQVIAQIHTWLREGGFFVFSTVPGDWENTKITWLGQEVVESTMPLAGYLACFNHVGFEIRWYSVSQFQPKDTGTGMEKHLFV